MKDTCIILFIVLFLASCQSADEPGIDKKSLPDLVRHVNTRMGTASTFQFSHGNVYPGTGLPWGMNTWTPMTGEMGSGWIYQYHKDSINGFRQTHQPSPWMNDYGTFAVMPVAGQLKTSIAERASLFSHDTEVASPHYYKVYLEDYDLNAEIVPTERSAILRFTFPEGRERHVVLDAFNRGGSVTILPEEQKIKGISRFNSGGVPENFGNYFVMEFNQPFTGYGLWNEDGEINLETTVVTNDKIAGGYVSFPDGGEVVIEVRIASSFISHEQAEINLSREIGEMPLEEIKEKGFGIWNRKLNRILAEGPGEEKIKTFYSTFYRSLLFPRRFYEYDREGKMVHYSPYDGAIHEGIMYADNGFWDTFRAVFPFFTLMYPDENAKMMQWVVNAYQQGGWMPIWPSPGYRRVMIGAHSTSLFADAMVKGIRDFDMKKAFEGVLQDAMKESPDFAPGRDGVTYYNDLGFVPYPEVREATAKTLEYAYNDFCIRQMAKILGEDSIAGVYEQKSFNYRNVFDEQSLLMRGRRKDGSFIREISPLAWGGPFTEGNAWHYTWSVFHDPQGLINLMGGRDPFIRMMDSVFSQPPAFEIGTYPYEIHEISEMVAADMGQYAHGNQPIQHMIYLYNYAGQPWKTQYWVREVLDKLYAPVAEGYCGDEDNGQTSAWYIFSALGFYPVCPGVPQYVLGSPLFEKVTIKLPNGKSLVISAPGNSPENRYISNVLRDGQEYRKTWISHEELLKGGEIRFEMTPEPGKAFGDEPGSFPFSLSN